MPRSPRVPFSSQVDKRVGRGVDRVERAPVRTDPVDPTRYLQSPSPMTEGEGPDRLWGRGPLFRLSFYIRKGLGNGPRSCHSGPRVLDRRGIPFPVPGLVNLV